MATVGPVSDELADLRSYYEREAELRSRRTLRGTRLGIRDDFLGLLADEGRSSVLDAGAGPGLDGRAFVAAGHRFVGVDLAGGNGRLAAEVGVTVIQGSITDLPIRPRSFDAGWSFSTLMHLPGPQAARAIVQLAAALRPGAPIMVGLWGREVEESIVDEAVLPGQRRPFRLRSFERNRELMTAGAEVERAERLEALSESWDYHVFRLRVGERRP